VELTPPIEEHQLQAVGFHPDGSTLFAFGYFSYEWSTATWQSLRDPLTGSSGSKPPRVVFWTSPSGLIATSPTGGLGLESHDRTLIATGDDSGEVFLTERVSRTELFRFAAQTGPITGLAFSPDDSLLAATSEDGTLFTWRVRDGVEVWHSGASIFPEDLVGASRDGTKVVLKSKGDRSVVSAADGNLLGKFPLEYGSCVTDKSGERLACSNEEGPNFVALNGVPRIAGIDPAAPELFRRGTVALVPDAPVFVQALTLSSDTALADHTVRLSNLDDAGFREILMPARATDSGGYFENHALALALSDDGQRLAAGVDARYSGVGAPRRDIGYLWDVSTLELHRRIPGAGALGRHRAGRQLGGGRGQRSRGAHRIRRRKRRGKSLRRRRSLRVRAPRRVAGRRAARGRHGLARGVLLGVRPDADHRNRPRQRRGRRNAAWRLRRRARIPVLHKSRAR